MFNQTVLFTQKVFNFLETTCFLKICLLDLLVSIALFLAIVVATKRLILFFTRKFLNVSFLNQSEDKDSLISALQRPLSFFFLLLGLMLAFGYAGVQMDFFLCIFKGISIFFICWFLAELGKFFSLYLQVRMKSKMKAELVDLLPLLQKIFWCGMLLLGVLMAADNFGYSIGGVLTTLGLGGAAFAFASKEALSNLWGSLSIVMDQSFKRGDWVEIGSRVSGVVESIGLRSTRIRTDAQTLLAIPNSVLANECINNWSDLSNLHTKQMLQLKYEANAEKIQDLLCAIRGLFEEDRAIDSESIVVRLTGFNGTTLNVLLNYKILQADWKKSMAVRESIHLKLLTLLSQKGFSLA